jgi:hypothetical protein
LGIGNTLGLFGDKPIVAFVNSDPDVPQWVQSAISTDLNISTMKFLYDRDNNGSVWNNSNATLELVAGATPDDDHAKFANQVWALEYCDTEGNNCITPTPVTATPTLWTRTYTSPSNDTYTEMTPISTTGICSVSGIKNGGCDTGFDASIQPDPSGFYKIVQTSYGDCDRRPEATYTCVKNNRICDVTFKSEVRQQGTETLRKSDTRTIQMPEGTTPRIGGVVGCPNPDTHFTLRFVDDPQSYGGITTETELGYWSQNDYTTYKTAIDSIPYKNIRSFTVRAGTVVSAVNVNMNCVVNSGGSAKTVKTHGSVSATVGSCQ